MFPIGGLTPGLVIDAISLVVLAVAVAALYAFRLPGPWRLVSVVTALLALYLNVFVGVVQAFQKLSFLQPLAPTQSEPPFQIAQGALLVLFILAGILAVRRFHPASAATAAAAACRPLRLEQTSFTELDWCNDPLVPRVSRDPGLKALVAPASH